MIWRWFLSRTVRQAVEMRRHLRKILNAQRDLLAPQAIQAIQHALEKTGAVLASGADKPTLRASMQELERTATKWLKPYPNPGWRENVDVLLVAVSVALCIRTFFLEPMKIPSGSMQPTLSGITHENLIDQPDFDPPNFFVRLYQSWIKGTRYFDVQAPESGRLQAVEAPQTILPFIKKQRYQLGDHWYTIWFPVPDLFWRADLASKDHRQLTRKWFEKGEDFIQLKATTGDFLFVDRMTYNFRRPQRGEIVIFESEGIPHLIPNTHYIKRLIGLPGDHIRIGNDRHLVVNGKRLDASTPRFEFIYSNDNQNPGESIYSGHANNLVLQNFGRGGHAKYFPDGSTEFVVDPDRYFVLGDNTMNSFDSRSWGDFPREKVIGKAGFVFWPISERFGWGFR